MTSSESHLIAPLLISTWVNSLLYGFVLVTGYHYFTTYQDDRKFFKILVAACIVVDTACTFIEYVGVYLYTISHFGDVSRQQSPNWTIGVINICTGVSAVLVQSFLVYRYFTFTRHRLATGLLTALASATLALSIVVGTLGLTSLGRTWFERHASLHIPTTLWLVFSAITNAGIAASLVYAIKAQAEGGESSAPVLKRLASNALSTGFFPTFIAIVTMIVYFIVSAASAPMTLGFIIGRAYTLTLLYNLSARTRLSSASSDDDVEENKRTRTNSESSFETPTRGSFGLSSILSFRTQTPMGMILQDPESSPETILASPRYSVVMSPIPDRAVGRIVKGRPRTADGLGEKSVGGRVKTKRTSRPMTADSALSRKTSYGSIGEDPFGGETGVGGSVRERTGSVGV